MTILESRRRAIFATATLAVIIAAAACSSSTPTSPTPASGSGGAVIEGRVAAPAGVGLDSGADSNAATSSTTGLQVTVVGTSLTATVNEAGIFRVVGVPAGRVKLQFNSASVNATTDIGQVATNEVVQLQVQVNATSAVVVSQSRAATLELCHAQGNGSFHMISVSPDAEPAHRAHGDGKVGDPIPGRTGQTFGLQCEPVGPASPVEGPKVTLCHKAGNKWIEITVSRDAEADHRAHGDGKVGEAVPGQAGKTFAAGCIVQ